MNSLRRLLVALLLAGVAAGQGLTTPAEGLDEYMPAAPAVKALLSAAAPAGEVHGLIGAPMAESQLPTAATPAGRIRTSIPYPPLHLYIYPRFPCHLPGSSLFDELTGSTLVIEPQEGCNGRRPVLASRLGLLLAVVPGARQQRGTGLYCKARLAASARGVLQAKWACGRLSHSLRWTSASWVPSGMCRYMTIPNTLCTAPGIT